MRGFLPFLQLKKNVKNVHGGVILLVKLQAEAYNFTKSNTPPWVFLTLFKMYIWNQIVQHITDVLNFILFLAIFAILHL